MTRSVDSDVDDAVDVTVGSKVNNEIDNAGSAETCTLVGSAKVTASDEMLSVEKLGKVVEDEVLITEQSSFAKSNPSTENPTQEVTRSVFQPAISSLVTKGTPENMLSILIAELVFHDTKSFSTPPKAAAP